MLQQSAPDVNALLLTQESSYVGTESDDISKIKCANLLHAFNLIIETRKLMKKHKVCKLGGVLEIYYVEHYFPDYNFFFRCSKKCDFDSAIYSTTNPKFYKGALDGTVIRNCSCDFTFYISEAGQPQKDMLPELTKLKKKDLKCANVLHSWNLIEQVMIYVAQHDQDCDAGGELTFQILEHVDKNYDFHFKCSKTCKFQKAFWSSTDPKRHSAAVYGSLTCACFFPKETDSPNPSKAQSSTTVGVPNVSPEKFESLHLNEGCESDSYNKRSSLHNDDKYHLENSPLPGTKTLLGNNPFVINYNHMTRIPNYVMEVLTPDSMEEDPLVNRKSINYEEDDEIPEKFRSTLADYKGSGFDKGHIAPAAYNKCHRECLGDSCQLSNMAPQVHCMNSGVWEDLEETIRKTVKQSQLIRICTGPLFTTSEEGGLKYRKFEVIGPNEVAVPSAYFKVLDILYKTGMRELDCYVVDEKHKKLEDCLVSRDHLSEIVGYEIFGDLKDDSFHVINKKTVKEFTKIEVQDSS